MGGILRIDADAYPVNRGRDGHNSVKLDTLSNQCDIVSISQRD
jgi:hypothetical protein